MEKAQLHPNAAKDEQGRLRVAAATTVGDDGFARTEALVDPVWIWSLSTRRMVIRRGRRSRVAH